MSQEKEWHDFPQLPNLTVLPWLIWCVVIVTIIWATSALAVPRVNNRQECQLVADMTLVAAALQKNGVSGKTRDAIMADTYAAPLTSEDAKRWQEIMSLTVRLVARDVLRDLPPLELSSGVLNDCMSNRGNLTPIFGTDA